MCYAAGSIDQACPMCQVFPHTRCPHVRETCRNRALHPRIEVVFMKNAEVERFNGCGYCKWARSTPTPPPETLRYNNPGWPGCCRPPSPTESRLIPAAEWRAVSIVHGVPIPLDIKVVLDSLTPRASGPPSGSITPSRSARPANDRKNSGSSSPSTRLSNGIPTLSKSVMTSTARTRPSPSPQPGSPNLSRTSSSTAISSFASNASPVDYHLNERPHRGTETPGKRVDGGHSLHRSPNRKDVDLTGKVTPSRVSSMRRPIVTPATTSVSVSKVVAGGPSPTKRRASISKPEKRESPAASPSRPSPAASRHSVVIPPSTTRKAHGDDDEISSASSSSGSSDGMGSLSDNTVTSDGGFTDYLSDESEAELQRQAEAKAALVALNMAEELEFKAARLQLAHVDLRPPKSWNPTNITNTTTRTIARSVAPSRS